MCDRYFQSWTQMQRVGLYTLTPFFPIISHEIEEREIETRWTYLDIIFKLIPDFFLFHYSRMQQQ